MESCSSNQHAVCCARPAHHGCKRTEPYCRAHLSASAAQELVVCDVDFDDVDTAAAAVASSSTTTAGSAGRVLQDFQPLAPEQQRQLAQLVWGEPGVRPEAAWQQGLIWNDAPGLEWGLLQLSGEALGAGGSVWLSLGSCREPTCSPEVRQCICVCVDTWAKHGRQQWGLTDHIKVETGTCVFGGGGTGCSTTHKCWGCVPCCRRAMRCAGSSPSPPHCNTHGAAPVAPQQPSSARQQQQQQQGWRQQRRGCSTGCTRPASSRAAAGSPGQQPGPVELELCDNLQQGQQQQDERPGRTRGGAAAVCCRQCRPEGAV